jgi:hypothetical protein
MKKLLICTCMALGLVASSTTVFATEVSRTSAGKSFTAPWELYASDVNWVMEYGFNTLFINEDYTHTKHNSTSHIAKVINANGTFTDSDSAGNWAEIEVTHSGQSITYKIVY